MAKIAVCGVVSYVGASLVSELLFNSGDAKGEVVVIENNVKKARQVLDKAWNASVKDLEGKGFTIVEVDVFNPDAIAEHIKGCDVVVNTFEFDDKGETT